MKTVTPKDLVLHFGVIRTQDQGIIPFRPFEWQVEFLKNREKYNKVIILKSRDIGSSTISVLDFTSRVVLYGGDFLIASYKKESSEFLFETAKIFLNNLLTNICLYDML